MKGIRMNLYAEFLKLRRTLVLPLVVLAPFVPALLIWGIFRGPRGEGLTWETFLGQGLVNWALLLLPLVVSLLVAQVTALEHTSGSWRVALALPRRRGWLLVEKLLVILLLTVLMNGLALVGLLLVTYALPHTLTGTLDPSQLFLHYGFVWLASLGMTLITLWVALRFSSFLAPSGIGAAATVTGFVLLNSERYGPWWPWTLAAYAMVEPALQSQVVIYSLALAAAAFVLSLIDFNRRDF
jgi:hypothetical protein